MRTTSLPHVLVFIIVVSVPALSLSSFIPVGIFGLLTPLLLLGMLFGYGRLAASTGSSWVREGGALVIGVVLGWGFFVAALLLGVLLGIVPFLSDGPHPHERLWTFASMVVGVAAAAAAWWALRRWALARAAADSR